MTYEPEGTLYPTSENRSAIGSIQALKNAAAEERILEARAFLCTEGHDLIVRLGRYKGIIPREEAALGIREGTVRDIAIISRVGHPVSFIVSRIDETGDEPLIFLSRRKAQQRCREEYLSRLTPGDIIPAKVTRLENFGAFLDIGCGLIALMPIDTMSVSRISHPSERLSPGQEIYAVVSSTENGRITLSLRELLGSWAENAALFRPGQTVSGIVRSIEEYGIFVELTPNLAGLAEKKPLHSGLSGDLPKPGTPVSVFIKSILPDRMKVKLVIIENLTEKEPPFPLHYSQTEGRLDRWVYSPESASRRIQTVFRANAEDSVPNGPAPHEAHEEEKH